MIRNGFTLVEVLIAMALLAILVAAGVPAFRAVIDNNHLTTQANKLVGALSLARGEAVKRNADVAIAQKDADWNNGWEVTAGGTTLRVYDTAQTRTQLSEKGNQTTITFKSTGTIDLAACFDLSINGGAGTRMVQISPSGAVTVVADSTCP